MIGMLASVGGAVANNWMDSVTGSKAQDRQAEINRQQADYSNKLGMQMADYTYNLTNTTAQMEQIRKNRLNPTLMYKGGGGGGQTVSTSGGQAAGVGMMPMGQSAGNLIAALGLARQRAEINNIEADTKQKEVEAAKTEGVDTESQRAGIEQIIQETKSEIAKRNLMNIQSELADTQTEMNQASLEFIAPTAMRNLEEMKGRIRKLNAEASLSEETKSLIKEDLKAKISNQYWDIAVKKSNINMNEEMINKTRQELEMGWQEVSQKWKGISNTEREVYVSEFLAKLKKENPEIGQVLGREAKNLIEGLYNILDKADQELGTNMSSETMPKREPLPKF